MMTFTFGSYSLSIRSCWYFRHVDSLLFLLIKRSAFLIEGPGDALLSYVRYHPVLPLGHDLQASPSVSPDCSHCPWDRGSSATSATKTEYPWRRSQQRGVLFPEASLTTIIFAEKRGVPWIRGCVIGFGSITSVPTATALEDLVTETDEGPMDGQLFARAVPSKFALG